MPVAQSCIASGGIRTILIGTPIDIWIDKAAARFPQSFFNGGFGLVQLRYEGE